MPCVLPYHSSTYHSSTYADIHGGAGRPLELPAMPPGCCSLMHTLTSACMCVGMPMKGMLHPRLLASGTAVLEQLIIRRCCHPVTPLDLTVELCLQFACMCTCRLHGTHKLGVCVLQSEDCPPTTHAQTLYLTALLCAWGGMYCMRHKPTPVAVLCDRWGDQLGFGPEYAIHLWKAWDHLPRSK
jgi:hypothetical protein